MVTIGIYSYYPRLLNDYTRIMRQYALQLTLAFLLMALNKKVHFRDCCGIAACQLNGNDSFLIIFIILLFKKYILGTENLFLLFKYFQDFFSSTSLSYLFHSCVHWQYSLGVRFSKFFKDFNDN